MTPFSFSLYFRRVFFISLFSLLRNVSKNSRINRDWWKKPPKNDDFPKRSFFSNEINIWEEKWGCEKTALWSTWNKFRFFRILRLTQKIHIFPVFLFHPKLIVCQVFLALTRLTQPCKRMNRWRRSWRRGSWVCVMMSSRYAPHKPTQQQPTEIEWLTFCEMARLFFGHSGA